METYKLIEKHQRAIKILEAIDHFKRRKEIIQESIDGVAGEFTALKADLEYKIDILDRCIKRVYQSYLKFTNQ